jgi:flagellar export protein FliJ
LKFRFRLERALKFVELKETVHKLEVASLTRNVGSLEKKKSQLEQSILNSLAKQSDPSAVAWMEFHMKRVVLDREEIRKTEKKIEEANEQLGFAKRTLIQITKKKKALEALREKRRQEFTVEESRRLQKTIDELYRLSKVGS